MTQRKNRFLGAYGMRIDSISKELDSLAMMSIPTGNIHLSEVSNLLRGAKREIERIEKEKDELNQKVDELTKEYNKLLEHFKSFE